MSSEPEGKGQIFFKYIIPAIITATAAVYGANTQTGQTIINNIIRGGRDISDNKTQENDNKSEIDPRTKSQIEDIHIQPVRSDKFTVSFSPVTHDTDYRLMVTIKNTMTEPLFIELNDSQLPFLIDDQNAPHNLSQSSGIARGSINLAGLELDENRYTKISPNESLTIPLGFYINNMPISKPGSKIKITSEFLVLKDRKVEKITLTADSYIK